DVDAVVAAGADRKFTGCERTDRTGPGVCRARCEAGVVGQRAAEPAVAAERAAGVGDVAGAEGRAGGIVGERVSAGERRAAGVDVGGSEDDAAGAGFREAARAADDAGKGERVGGVADAVA